MIRFGRDYLQNLSCSSSREWLETNGLGGYASSTICGMNTRRYHGLLVAATRPPVERTVLLSSLLETLRVGDVKIDLSTNRYAGALHPEGYYRLAEFRLDPWPITVFEAGGARIEKSVAMIHGVNATVIRYRLLNSKLHGVALELRPLVAFRSYHDLTRANETARSRYGEGPGVVTVAMYEVFYELRLAHNARAVCPTGHWYRDFLYTEDERRGQECIEDLWQPLCFEFDLGAGQEATLIASIEPHAAGEAERLLRNEKRRRDRLLAAAGLPSRERMQRQDSSQGTDRTYASLDGLRRSLTLAADAFLVKRGSGMTVIAGYPWFTDWSRDTMIALEGLTLCTGRPHVARDILLAFAEHASEGMLPNRFPDAGASPEYNTVDGTLWYFQAIGAYIRATGDLSTVRELLYPMLENIVQWHIQGTRYGIRMDEDGLLLAGSPGAQLTWMDAKVGDRVVTPRYGKPVEVQALWFNALRVMDGLARSFGDGKAAAYAGLARKAKTSFNRQFWNAKEGCLYDVIGPEGPDASIRPNQLIALSLAHSMVSAERARSILGVAERELLTPVGLRTLSPSHPSYRGRYEGDMRERDSRYHQGSAWPWLAGPYLSALLRFGKPKNEARAKAEEWLVGFAPRLLDAGLGQACELYDGDSPHRPAGCPAQAWSVAELLRATCLLST